MSEKNTTLTVKTKIYSVAYTCPHCKERTEYDTNSLPPKYECHKCLKPLKFEIIIDTEIRK